MTIDKYKKEDGSYVDEEGTHYDDAISFLSSGVLGFCGCGNPRSSLEFVRDVLVYIDEPRGNLSKPYAERVEVISRWMDDASRLFQSEGAKYFMFYVMDNLGLTEHGGSVPGWLTEKGRNLMHDISELLTQPDEPS